MFEELLLFPIVRTWKPSKNTFFSDRVGQNCAQLLFFLKFTWISLETKFCVLFPHGLNCSSINEHYCSLTIGIETLI